MKRNSKIFLVAMVIALTLLLPVNALVNDEVFRPMDADRNEVMVFA